jgi:hypothetical protein
LLSGAGEIQPLFAQLNPSNCASVSKYAWLVHLFREVINSEGERPAEVKFTSKVFSRTSPKSLEPSVVTSILISLEVIPC